MIPLLQCPVLVYGQGEDIFNPRPNSLQRNQVSLSRLLPISYNLGPFCHLSVARLVFVLRVRKEQVGCWQVAYHAPVSGPWSWIGKEACGVELEAQ